MGATKRHALSALAAFAVLAGLAAATSGDAAQPAETITVKAEAGDTWASVAAAYGYTGSGSGTDSIVDTAADKLQRFNNQGVGTSDTAAILVGRGIDVEVLAAPPATSTTTAPSTSSTTTSTVPETTTTSTTAAPTTTTTTPPTSTEPPAGAFLEDFTGDTTVALRHGSWHRAVQTGYLGDFGGSWAADHADHGGGGCGGPTTTRGVTVHADPLDVNDDEVVFLCQSVDGDPAKAHLMSTMGNVDGYSVVWFSPDRVFTTQRTVSWDVNVTDIGGRSWWEVAILPLSAPDVVAEPEIAREIASGLPAYPAGAVVVGNGPFGGELNVWANDRNQVWDNSLCYRPAREISIDPEGCASKALRRPWSVTDNGNGTITVGIRVPGDGNGDGVVDPGELETVTRTVPGRFPAGGFKVVFKSHAYTPDKDYNGAVPLPAFTWHWDNLSIR